MAVSSIESRWFAWICGTRPGYAEYAGPDAWRDAWLLAMCDREGSSATAPSKEGLCEILEWIWTVLLNDFWNYFMWLTVSCNDRNTPTDKSKSPVTYDDMVELYNQTSIFIGTKDFKINFWNTVRFLYLNMILMHGYESRRRYSKHNVGHDASPASPPSKDSFILIW